MKDLNLTEEMFLLAVWKLKEDAYGVKIRKFVSEETGRIYPYGTLYSALDKLVQRGFLTKEVGDPTPERGGRSNIYYYITTEGSEALKEALRLKNLLWDGISEVAFDR